MKTSGGVRKPVIAALDAGGTLTDTVIVDAEGNFYKSNKKICKNLNLRIFE